MGAALLTSKLDSIIMATIPQDKKRVYLSLSDMSLIISSVHPCALTKYLSKILVGEGIIPPGHSGKGEAQEFNSSHFESLLSDSHGAAPAPDSSPLSIPLDPEDF